MRAQAGQRRESQRGAASWRQRSRARQRGVSFVWARQLGGSDLDQGNGIAVDGAGAIYTVGAFNDTADFDPGPGVFNLTSAGSSDAFVSKLDSAGNLIWALQLGGSNG